MKKKTKYILITFVITILLALTGAYFYLSDSYAPTEEAMTALKTTEEVRINEKEDYVAFIPENIKEEKGLIFYQGGKVEGDAYAPLLKEIAEAGIPTYLAKMPFNLAVFNPSAAESIIESEKEIESWYLAGHSLGGAMASSYAEKNSEKLEGLILLASYSSIDLRETELTVLSIYGTEDMVLNKEKYQENRSFLPNLEELVIKGGNHAYFGSYGEQEGDGVAYVPPSEQVEKSIQSIIEFIEK